MYKISPIYVNTQFCINNIFIFLPHERWIFCNDVFPQGNIGATTCIAILKFRVMLIFTIGMKTIMKKGTYTDFEFEPRK